ncbi:MAG: sulfotransferase domain-containing protein [Acidimicrobiales bacterium]
MSSVRAASVAVAAGCGDRLCRGVDGAVFVVGSPRSGTTFLGGVVGGVDGFVDLGEVPALKSRIAAMRHRPARLAAMEVRHVVTAELERRGAPDARPVIHAPEVVFVLRALPYVGDRVRAVHLVRDGRDVVCSLMEQGWLASSAVGVDEAGWHLGGGARFWTERSRRAEFARVPHARRAAWAWRRYVEAGLEARETGLLATLRYERMCGDPRIAAARIARHLGVAPEQVDAGLAEVTAGSVGRYRRDLSRDDLPAVLSEAGALLERLGYLGDTP